jgi:dsDNA-specific endonuclease/ATPase MutS2
MFCAFLPSLLTLAILTGPESDVDVEDLPDHAKALVTEIHKEIRTIQEEANQESEKILRQADREIDQVRKKANEKVKQLKESLIGKLKPLQESHVKNGKLDEALAIREQIRRLKMEPIALKEVEVEWGQRWWPAEILQVKGDKYLIHYTGFEASWDEWVRKDRIRSPQEQSKGKERRPQF